MGVMRINCEYFVRFYLDVGPVQPVMSKGFGTRKPLGGLDLRVYRSRRRIREVVADTTHRDGWRLRSLVVRRVAIGRP